MRRFQSTCSHLVIYFFFFCVAASHAQSTPPAPVQQSITVTADRGLAGFEDSSANTTILTPQQLTNAPGLTLDDSLHQVAGFQLYRRTSSRTANPTTEGISLRGLGSTAASRTLVISDQVPLNDPYGAWIHWNEIPTLALQSVNILRGGAADLYGSSAIGGVIEAVPITPASTHIAADVLGATENTANGDLLATTSTRYGSALGALTILSTGGYIPIAPSARGPVDIPANVASQAARIELRTPAMPTLTTAFLRGNLLNESRDNGTRLQTNATRLWRYQAGADLNANNNLATIRLFGARESYRQSFTSIPTARTTETLTKLQQVPNDNLGAALQLTHPFSKQAIAALGFDINDVRGTDNETSPSSGITQSTAAHQRAIGGFLAGAYTHAGTQLSASIRVDSFHTFDAQQVTSNSTTRTPLPSISELVANPHLGISQSLTHTLTLYASGFRAFRGPSLNELYRTSQVGQQITDANSSLLSERATGFELGANAALFHALDLHADYFWTEVNRPISAVQIATNTYQRQNLGQLRSRGLELTARTHPWQHLDASFNYQLAVATITAFNTSSPAQANLTGKWLPEVPRNAFASAVNYAQPHALNLHLFASYQGREYDDALNTELLHPYARFDLSADRAITHRLTVFAETQNLLNRTIDAGITPTLTLAAPRLVEGGLRYTFFR